MPTKVLHIKSPSGEVIYFAFHSLCLDNYAKVWMKITKTSHINLRFSKNTLQLGGNLWSCCIRERVVMLSGVCLFFQTIDMMGPLGMVCSFFFLDDYRDFIDYGSRVWFINGMYYTVQWGNRQQLQLGAVWPVNSLNAEFMLFIRNVAFVACRICKKGEFHGVP